MALPRFTVHLSLSATLTVRAADYQSAKLLAEGFAPTLVYPDETPKAHIADALIGTEAVLCIEEEKNASAS